MTCPSTLVITGSSIYDFYSIVDVLARLLNTILESFSIINVSDDLGGHSSYNV